MSKTPKSSPIQKFLPLLLLVVAGILLMEGLSTNSSKKDEVSARSAKAQEVVNKHLENTAERLELQKRRMQIENSRLAMEFSRTNPETPYVPPQEDSQLKEAEAAHQVAKDLGRSNPTADLPSDPVALVHQRLFEESIQKEADAAYREEYARQFVENARRAGWSIVLSDDYRVLSVKKIRRPSSGKQYNLFQDVSPAQ